MARHNDAIRNTLVAAVEYEALVDSTRGSAAVRATLPVGEDQNAALVAMRDEVLADIYSEILTPA